jgi:signal transduction histidine kinase
MSDGALNYIVGVERRLADLLGGAEVRPLLAGAVAAGVAEAALLDDTGAVLWAEGDGAGCGCAARAPLCLEGEPVGTLQLRGDEAERDRLPGMVRFLQAAVNALLTANLKRMLTVETHTSVVNLTYDELLETNRRLAASERGYRELAEQLEVRVAQRTGELRQAHARLLQREKMASVGQLAAGIAHEVNNPLGFITSNLTTLGRYAARLLEMLDWYAAAVAADPPTAARAAEKGRGLKLDLIRGDMGELLSQSLAGAERVKKIVADLRGFSHIDDPAESLVDLNGELGRTLEVMARQIPAGTEVRRRFGELSPVRGNPALLCQLFAGIVQNAIQARPEGLVLEIRTEVADGTVRVAIGDNGPGIPSELRGRVFEPFFTTRSVGDGTGMGLTVAYDIVTALGGTIEAGEADGGGALITVALPPAG